MLPSQQVLHNFAEQLSLGLRQLKEHCQRIYPQDPQPKCLRPEKSFILESGTDPLDFIYVYKNAGQTDQSVPKHWHYIGFGLSDIHGYSIFCLHHESLRATNSKYAESTPPMTDIYPPSIGQSPVSGFGFELTMRVKCNSDEEWQADPPQWPGRIMQDLARYVFQSRNVFKVGDHVAWHSPLDSAENGAGCSRIEHVLLTLDPQLAEAQTEYGSVKFIQIVGVCEEELEAAREWNVRGVLDMMQERQDSGGPFLVTDMRRGESIFDLDPDKCARIELEIERSGSDMAQISARHKTSYTLPEWFTRAQQELAANMYEASDGHGHGHGLSFERQVLRPSEPADQQLAEDDDRPPRPASRMSLGSESGLCIENIDLSDTRYYNSIYLMLSAESARVLHVMVTGRLAHRRHFSFQSFKGDSLVTFIPEGSNMKSLVEPPGKPFAKQGHWLQIYVPDELREQMSETIASDFSRERGRRVDEDGDEHGSRLNLPRNYSWPEFNLHLTIVEEIPDDH